MASSHQVPSVRQDLGKVEQDKVQALRLAQVLSTKDANEIRNIAQSNPALLREWIAELAAGHDHAKQEAEQLNIVLHVLSGAERSRNLGMAA